MRHRLCFLSIIILLIILQGLPFDLSAQVFEPEKEEAAPTPPRKPTPKPRNTQKTNVTPPKQAEPYAYLIISTDLDIDLYVNGKLPPETVLTTEQFKRIPLDEGENFVKVVPKDGGDDGFIRSFKPESKGQKMLFEVKLGAKRRVAEEERRAAIRRQEEEERKKREEEERRLAPVREIEANMVRIEGGSFVMGCTSEQSDCATDESPTHRVNVSSFYLSKYEVTVSQFGLFVKETGYRTEAEKEGWSWSWTGSSFEKREGVDWRCDERGEVRSQWEQDYPVIHISWNDAQAFCRWLSEKAGKTYRLPSESEWEYAARGGNKSRGYKYAGSNSLDEVGWYGDNSGKKPHKVGEKRANELGLYDMSGNVWEWCQDCWNESYAGAPTNGSAWRSGDCGKRVLRGGSWLSLGDGCRVSIRNWVSPTYWYYYFGFRLAQGR